MAIEVTTDEQKAMGEADVAAVRRRKIPGSEYLYNRLPRKFDKVFDGIRYTFEPHEIRLMAVGLARWMYAHSAISFEPVTGQQVFALVTPDDEKFGVPYTQPIGPEYLDRSLSPTVKVDGLSLKPKVVPVPGGGYDGGKLIADPDRLS